MDIRLDSRKSSTAGALTLLLLALTSLIGSSETVGPLEAQTMKILLAVDGSAPSLVARDLVASLPWPRGTSVELIAAYEIPIDWTGGVGSTMDWVGDVEDATRDELATMLDEIAGPLRDAGLTVRPTTGRGRPPTVILDAARQLGVEVIVTGSRGRGPLKSMLLGSVASEVSTNADVPVLVARAAAIKRLVVATDGSASSSATPDRLAEWGVFESIPTDVIAVSVPESPAFELMVGIYTLGQADLDRERAEMRDGRRRRRWPTPARPRDTSTAMSALATPATRS